MRACGVAILVVASLAGAVSAEVVPQKKWLEVRSPHFRVMGDVAVRELRRVAERMEQLHAALGQLTRTKTVNTADVTVVVFRDQRGFLPFAPRYEGKPVPVAGYFMPGPMNYIAILSDRDYDYSSVVYHEYVHLVASRAVGQLPAWLSEGLAEFYSTFEVMDGGRTVQLGRVPMHHLERLRHEFLPLATLASVDHSSPYYNERDKGSAFYAESWAFVHFLYLGKERKYGSRFGPFVEALMNGVPFEKACAEQLGTSIKELEQEVRAYLGSLLFTAMRGTLPDSLGAIARLEPTPVTEAEAHSVLAELLLFHDRLDEARAHLDHALTVDAGHALVLSRLAELTAAGGKQEEAKSFLSRGAAAPGATYLSAYYRVRALEALGVTDTAVLVSAWRDVTTANPNFAEGLTGLAQARADAREDLDGALQLQRRAMELAPGRDEYALGLARILIFRGDTKPARDLLGQLVARGSSSQIKATARRYLGMAAQMEIARSKAATDTPEPGAAGTPVPDPPLTIPPEPAVDDPAVRFDFRRPVAGEAQLFGALTDIECRDAGSVVVVATDGGPRRFRGARLDRLEFVSFRADLSGEILCGSQFQAPPALVTYRPAPDSDSIGEVVVVEIVPVGFKKAP